MTKASVKQAERDEARERLEATGLVVPGSTVYTILRHVSKSGMTRHIDLYAVTDEGPFYLSGYAATLMDDRRNDDGAIIVGGCGMDMGFSLVYNLSRSLYPNGHYCTGLDDYSRGCPSNDHSNDRGKSDYSPSRHHSDGGYALRQRWL